MSKAFLLLGRLGDEIIMLPIWKHLHDSTGEKPVVVVAKEFASLFNGVSYVEADAVNVHWYGGLHAAAQMAKLKYGQCTIIQCNGFGHATSEDRYPSFGEAMWAKAGFEGQYGTLPLVFDRRNAEREAALVERFTGKKPLLLYNFTGVSSPLPCAQEVLHRLRRYERDFTLLSLAMVKGKFLYDLLGLFDRAAGLICHDSAPLHLARASDVPLLAYCRGGWSSAIPKEGALRIEYAEAHKRLDAVDEFVESLTKSSAAAT